MPRPSELATVIVAKRASAKMTQQELADRAGITRTALSDIENGRTTDPRRDTLERLAAALDDTLPGLQADAAALRDPLMQAKRDLPDAPADAQRRYARLTLEVELAADEMSELRRQYGAQDTGDESSPRQQGGDC